MLGEKVFMESASYTYRSQVSEDGDDEERHGVEETDKTQEGPSDSLLPGEFAA